MGASGCQATRERSACRDFMRPTTRGFMSVWLVVGVLVALTAVADEPSAHDQTELVDTSPTGPSPPRPWAIGGRIAGVTAIGVLPQVGLGTELAVTLRRHDLLAEVAGTRWLASEAQIHSGRP